MKNCESVIMDKKYADMSIKSSRLYVCFDAYSADSFLLSHNLGTENIKATEEK